MTTRAEMVVHLVDVHDEQLPRRRKPRERRAALGEDLRSPLTRALDRFSALLVASANLVVIIIVVGMETGLGPIWWALLSEAVGSVTLWLLLLVPTVAYLALRDRS